MTYHIEPKTEEELNLFGVLEEGIYDFEVNKSEDKISSSGNPMNKLSLKLWDKDGSIKLMTDYLVFSSANFCVRKIKHFCDATGISEEYKNGEVRTDFSGLCGKVKLKIKAGDLIPDDKLGDRPAGSKYFDKNEVEDYVVIGKHEGMKPLPAPTESFDDADIPF